MHRRVRPRFWLFVIGVMLIAFAVGGISAQRTLAKGGAELTELAEERARLNAEREELTDTRTVSEIVKAYAMFERGLMYDWCLSGGEYSLVQYAREMMPLFLDGFRKK